MLAKADVPTTTAVGSAVGFLVTNSLWGPISRVAHTSTFPHNAPRRGLDRTARAARGPSCEAFLWRYGLKGGWSYRMMVPIIIRFMPASAWLLAHYLYYMFVCVEGLG
jgi:hypothetical protein